MPVYKNLGKNSKAEELKKEEQKKKDDEEAMKKKREEMDAEIQKKVIIMSIDIQWIHRIALLSH